MPTFSAIADELLRTLLAYEDGVPDEQIRVIFGARYEQLATAINELLGANRIQLFTQGNALVYKAIKEETALKFEGLGPEQMLVHQIIERAGNRGIWTRDIKLASSIPQHMLTKTLKILEQRSLIKSIRSVVSKSKKLYVLFDVVPAKSVTGGPWYSDQEFDHEFVSELSNFIVQMVHAHKEQMMDLAAIAEKIRISGISKIELSPDETELVVNTLVYDGRLEEINSSVLQLSGYAVGKKVYKVSKMTDTPDYLTAAPCGVCPVRHQCSEGGLISPATCPYLTDWLDDRTTTAERSYSMNIVETTDLLNTGKRRGSVDMSW
eukprot:gene19805-22512_t